MDDGEIVIKFDDFSEINATREVLEVILDMQDVKEKLSIYDYQRIKNITKQLWHNSNIRSDNSFSYRGYEFVLIKIHSPIIVDKVVCFMSNNKHDILIPWHSENTDIIEAGKMPPDTLLIVIDNYLDN